MLCSANPLIAKHFRNRERLTRRHLDVVYCMIPQRSDDHRLFIIQAEPLSDLTKDALNLLERSRTELGRPELVQRSTSVIP